VEVVVEPEVEDVVEVVVDPEVEEVEPVFTTTKTVELAGRSATSCPMLELELPLWADLSPVAAAEDIARSAPSTLIPHRPFATVSKRSLMPDGGLTDCLALLPKKPTTAEPATLAVTEGAVIVVPEEVKRPLWASTGEERSTPP